MKTKHFFYVSTFALAAVLTSCKKDKPDSVLSPVLPPNYGNGVYITNEGAFGSGTGTISFYYHDTISNDIFEAKNSYPLGNIVQSMELFNGKGYIVVNNAGKVEVVDASSFASSAPVTGFTYPRYFLGIDNNKGYVSEWGAGGVAGSVKVVDLTTKTITATISTGNGAEGMLKMGNYVYVACSGGFGNDSVVTVINATTNAFVTNINVGANPKSLKVDNMGKIWVLCSGQYNATYTALVKTGRLVRVDAASNVVDLSLPFTSTTSQPSSLVINSVKTTLYYSYSGKVYSQSTASSTLNATPVISRSFYGLGIDPTNDYFYGSDAGDFVSNGKVIRYKSTGAVIDSFTVGVIPGNFCFK